MTAEERIEAVRRAICCPDPRGCLLAQFPDDPTACQAKHEVTDAEAHAAITATLQSLRAEFQSILDGPGADVEGPSYSAGVSECVGLLDAAIKEHQ